MEMRLFYHKALTAGKTYRGFEGTEKIAVPYGIEITGQNNVNIKSVDFGQLTNNYLKMRNKAPFKDLWQSPDEFTQDAHTYFTNHSKGDPGATAIGIKKRDAINSLANFGTQLHQDSNPLVGSLPTSVRPIIKSYRIDRANQITATGTMRPFVSEEQYRRMNMNYLPQSAPEGQSSNLEALRKDLQSKGIETDMYEKRGLITLSRIVVPKDQRSQGLGSSAMQDIIDYADRTGQRIGLSPSTDFGGTSRSRLEDFYKRFGFKNNKGRYKDFTVSESMIRNPKAES
jgi:GNAT superfamily N-acetyltransferase